MNIKDIVKDNFVIFNRFRCGVLYYKVEIKEGAFEFPVPVEDLGNATVHRVEKAMTLMRYIRKSLNENTFQKIVGTDGI